MRGNGPRAYYPWDGGTTELMSGISSLLGYSGGAPLNSGMPWRLSRTPGRIRLPAPCLGEHSSRVLTEYLDLQVAELADLEQVGITGQNPPID